ncbi:response regulator [Cupriavidus pinatubonensis]|uniref:response regulator n=1 Tax=Cupriavidus pinatubonensis TaxID=248026 RepID=UPI001C734753|nr:response regulator [Cupriavidus pinatubonensis]QYY27959.1 response regulator [Cupriavidus pinatubonensis]
MAEEPDFYSTREAARRLGVSLRSIQVWVESGRLPAWKTDGGHRRIPRTAVETLATEQDQARAASSRPPTIILIDDDPYMLDLCQRVISTRLPAVRLEVAQNGFEGLLMIGKVNPDLIVLDLMMPGMDGFRLIHALGRVPHYCEIGTVVMTGLTEEEIAAHGGLPAAVTVLRKPQGVLALPETIEMLLKLPAGHEAAAA